MFSQTFEIGENTLQQIENEAYANATSAKTENNIKDSEKIIDESTIVNALKNQTTTRERLRNISVKSNQRKVKINKSIPYSTIGQNEKNSINLFNNNFDKYYNSGNEKAIFQSLNAPAQSENQVESSNNNAKKSNELHLDSHISMSVIEKMFEFSSIQFNSMCEIEICDDLRTENNKNISLRSFVKKADSDYINSTSNCKQSNKNIEIQSENELSYNLVYDKDSLWAMSQSFSEINNTLKAVKLINTNVECNIDIDNSLFLDVEIPALDVKFIKDNISEDLSEINDSLNKTNLNKTFKHSVQSILFNVSASKTLIPSSTLLSNWGLPDSVLKEYSAKGIIEMFKWQSECLSNPRLLFESSNLVYSAPTSAGKTLVSEILIIRTVIERRKKGIIILPFISVVREKMFYFQVFSYFRIISISYFECT